MNKSASTRLDILQKAFELIYKNGYQATSIDVIIASTNVTKGAFFYHFKNKESMGLALIEEVLSPGMYASMVRPLETSEDILEAIYQMMEGLLIDNPFFNIAYGCPAINLIEEMGPLNEAFADALRKIVLQWQEAIQKSLYEAQESGRIAKNTSPQQAALFITAGYGGVRNMGKILGKNCYLTYLKAFKHYLSTLK
ncbi:TetR/AcrR family transcriptional regulator [Dyadobacter sp. CY326]|uniref:TetR/AcrR family transcriptional regulator n=1 Tax=Dyadobacter sp. CY326 TaxID=2907300 RepID=UPI001F39EFCA|nr:TetR/AcrR family transcriptional regulator [Dyadobacter sp. CY326]MCE7066405.1 TetR/AcrR family transcriptional regulator [Dyadobacter sp. CY326]